VGFFISRFFRGLDENQEGAWGRHSPIRRG